MLPLSLVATYADAMHDAARRHGVRAAEAVAVVADAAVGAAAASPESIDGFLAGWLRSVEVYGGLGGAEPAGAPVGDGSDRVRTGLAALDPDSRRLLVLRDGYDLPPGAIGTVMGLARGALDRRLAAARLALLAGYLGGPAPAPGTGLDCPPDPGELAAVADGSAAPARGVVLRGHTYRCVRCEDVLDAQARARRMVAAVPLLRPDPAARTALRDAVAAGWAAATPAVAVAAIEPPAPSPRARRLLAGAVAAVALVAGFATFSYVGRPSAGREVAQSGARWLGARTAAASPAPARPPHRTRPRPARHGADPVVRRSAAPPTAALPVALRIPAPQAHRHTARPHRPSERRTSPSPTATSRTPTPSAAPSRLPAVTPPPFKASPTAPASPTD